MTQSYYTNSDLIQSLVERGILKSSEIVNAFRKADRADFLTDAQRSMAYFDGALPTLSGQTISQPYTVAFMLELLGAKSGEKVLDVGSGSGWTTALLSEIVGGKGEVTGTEILPELVEFGRKNLAKNNYDNAKIVQAMSGSLGVRGSQFDRILVSATATALPKQLLDQLKPSGVMVIPVGENIVKVTIDKDGKIDEESYPGFVFVPLV